MYTQIDSVVIAKFDGTENEHPDIEVEGFPSLFLFPAEKGAKPISFEGGDRSLKVRLLMKVFCSLVLVSGAQRLLVRVVGVESSA